MGASASVKGAQSEIASNSAIDKMMRIEESKQEYTHRIILLGPGDSGKTTILKQMRKIHGSEEKAVNPGFAPLLKERVMGYMQILCEESIRLHVDIEEKNRAHREYFAHQLTMPYNRHFTVETVEKMKCLWSDKGIQQTLKRRREFQIPDNVAYFFNERLDDIASANYRVTFDDFLRIRMRTIGFNSHEFKSTVNGTEFKFVFTDVGGQRTERKKWMNMMHDDIDAVLYIVAISEYDLLCYEDDHTNRLEEAFNLFRSVIKNGFCRGKTVTLFLNKFDLLQEKLNDPASKTIDEFFADFPKDWNARDCEDVIKYVYGKFVDIYQEAGKEGDAVPHHHTTTALSTKQIEMIMHDIEGDLIGSRLQTVGF